MSNTAPCRPCRHPLLNKRFGLPIMVFAAFGMLFWMKLKLSVDVPRMAYAEPDRPTEESKPAVVPVTDELQDGTGEEAANRERRPNEQD